MVSTAPCTSTFLVCMLLVHSGIQPLRYHSCSSINKSGMFAAATVGCMLLLMYVRGQLGSVWYLNVSAALASPKTLQACTS